MVRGVLDCPCQICSIWSFWKFLEAYKGVNEGHCIRLLSLISLTDTIWHKAVDSDVLLVSVILYFVICHDLLRALFVFVRTPIVVSHCVPIRSTDRVALEGLLVVFTMFAVRFENGNVECGCNAVADETLRNPLISVEMRKHGDVLHCPESQRSCIRPGGDIVVLRNILQGRIAYLPRIFRRLL
jgi:hypothetical protein